MTNPLPDGARQGVGQSEYLLASLASRSGNGVPRLPLPRHVKRMAPGHAPKRELMGRSECHILFYLEEHRVIMSDTGPN
jgi:hypothetical protein